MTRCIARGERMGTALEKKTKVIISKRRGPSHATRGL